MSVQQDFIDSIVPYAQQGQAKYGVFASVTIAQACWESAYGQYSGDVVQVDHNLFGIKYYGNHDPDLVITQGSKVGDGAGYYCHYESIGDSCIDHGYFLRNNSRYAEAGVFDATNGKDQLKCIMNAGYAESAYYEGACSIIDTYNLYQYDTGSISDPYADQIESAVAWMESIANDDSHGYDQTYRWGEYGDYDCSSLVISGYEQAGIKLKTNGATFTGNLKEVALKLGFKEVTISDWSDSSQFKRGDIILNEVHHVCCATGNGMIVQASINENGEVSGGKAGDQTGKEIYISDYYIYSHGWDCCLRLGNGGGATPITPTTPDINADNYKEYLDQYFYEIDDLGYVYKQIEKYKPSLLKTLNDQQINDLKILMLTSSVHMEYSFNHRKKEVGFNNFGNKIVFDTHSYIIRDVEKSGLIKIAVNSGSEYYKNLYPLYIKQTSEDKENNINMVVEILQEYIKKEDV